MEPVNYSLQKWILMNKDFQKKHTQMKQSILNDPSVQSFLLNHPNISESVIDKNLVKLYEYLTQSKQCDNCTSLSACKNILPGYSPVLQEEQNDIHLSYEKCRLKLLDEKEKGQKSLMKSMYIPREILSANISHIDSHPERSEAIRELFQFLDEAKHQLPRKGLYFYGPFGVGKTYFLGALANKLKEYNISSLLVYMPEFAREIKNSFKDDTVNEKINYFKKADVLMLDDIGAESQSAWFRDEVLGSILQYRMMEKLPVFFTSNYSMNQLEEQLAWSTKGGIEEVKAGRIMERVKQVSQEVPMFGQSRRT